MSSLRYDLSMRTLPCLAVLLLVVTGCIKVGLDPRFPAVNMADLPRVGEPNRVRLEVQCTSNGEPDPYTLREARYGLASAAVRSGYFTIDDKDPDVLHVRIAETYAGGVKQVERDATKTMLTFGAAGTYIDARQEIRVELVTSDGTRFGRDYSTVVYGTMGNRKLPAGVEAMHLSSALQEFFDRIIFHFVLDHHAMTSR